MERFKLDRANPSKLPIPAGTVLKRSDESQDQGNASQPLEPTEIQVYQQIVGSLIYLSNGTRIDLCYATGQLARHIANPTIRYLQLAKQALRYLQGTTNYGITYDQPLLPQSNAYKLYSDATWGTEEDRASFQGWAVLRSGGAISWISQRQKSTALSSMEAEFIAASEASREAAWLEKLTGDLNEVFDIPPVLYCDNLGTIDLIHDHKFHSKAKHIDIRCNFIRNDMLEKGRLTVEHIAGTDQPADILTKQLPIEQYKTHLRTLGIREA